MVLDSHGEEVGRIEPRVGAVTENVPSETVENRPVSSE